MLGGLIGDVEVCWDLLSMGEMKESNPSKCECDFRNVTQRREKNYSTKAHN